MSDFSPAQTAARDYAVNAIRYLNPEDLADLRQELSIRLLKWPEHSLEDLKPLARKVAFDLAAEIRRKSETQAKLARAFDLNEPWLKSEDLWEPTWYAPHPEALEGNPFACAGARVMTVCERGGRLNAIEDCVLALVFRPSSKRKKATKRWTRKPAV